MEKYIKLEQIGRGSFGTVHKIKRVMDGQIMVWKELDYGKMSDKEKQLVVGEVNILRELRHPYILRYHDRIIDKKSTKLYIIVEFCERGDLRHLIKRAKSSRTFVHEERIWKYFAQILSALKTCHRRREKGALKPILHRDIKPANVFLDRDDNAKLGDFGLARALDSMSKFAYTNVGTPFYMAPEQTNSKKYDERADVWAVGCLLYELAALRPPFHASNQLALAMKINAGRFERIPKHYSDNLYRAIRWMLHTEPTRRPRVEDLESLPEIRAQQAKWAAGGAAAATKADGAAAAARKAERRGSTATAATTAATPAATTTAAALLADRESKMRKRELRLADAESRLARKEADVAKRETRLKLREEQIKLREESLVRREKRYSAAYGGAAGHRRTSSSSTTAKMAAQSQADRKKRSVMSTTSKESAPPAPSTRQFMIATDATAAVAIPLPTTKSSSTADDALEALEAAKKRLERMSKAPRAALQEVGNDKDKREEWSAQAQVDKILRKAKERERSSKYNNKLTAR
jgi:NIMA (never in mitosis gene a)-related kinase